GLNASGDFRPSFAAVGRTMKRAFRSAVDERPDMSATLIGSRDENVRIARIKDHVGDASVLGDFKNLEPGAAAVGRFVESSIAARPPKRALRCDVNRVRVARIDEDLADVFGLFEAE